MNLVDRHPHISKGALALAALSWSISGCAAMASTASATSKLKLLTTSGSITDYSYDGSTILNTNSYIEAESPFEVTLKRSSYSEPIRATQTVHSKDGKASSRNIPSPIFSDFFGFPDFLDIALDDASGKPVLTLHDRFCPADSARPVLKGAATSSPYPKSCPANPFALESHWGMPRGWGAAPQSPVVQLPPGSYTAHLRVAEPYRSDFGFPNETKTLRINIRQGVGQAPALTPAGAGPASPYPAPVGPPSVPDGPRPELRALPAWGIDLQKTGGREYLSFGATVWNAGPSPLAIVGIRYPGAKQMRAYQYFFDAQGGRTGYTPIGELDWDSREGHRHWHFEDFARYRLLDAHKNPILNSQKTGFCLANTDLIDSSLGGDRQPSNTSLATACNGAQGEQSKSLLEILYPGNGDTYTQAKPGQSFDVTGLPNGIYYIEVTADPDHHVHGTITSSATALREITISGGPAQRMVRVSPVGLVNSQ